MQSARNVFGAKKKPAVKADSRTAFYAIIGVCLLAGGGYAFYIWQQMQPPSPAALAARNAVAPPLPGLPRRQRLPAGHLGLPCQRKIFPPVKSCPQGRQKLACQQRCRRGATPAQTGSTRNLRNHPGVTMRGRKIPCVRPLHPGGTARVLKAVPR